MSAGALESDTTTNHILRLVYALPCAVYRSSEAVFCVWGMKGDNFDDEITPQIREMASGLAYALIALPAFKI